MGDLIVAVFLWGLSFSLAKKALLEFSPFQLVTLRLALGSLAAFFLARRSRNMKSGWRGPIILGIFEFAGTYIFYTWALSYLPSGVVGTLTLLTPIFTFLVGILLGVEFFSWRAGLATLISFLGAALCFPLMSIFGNLKPSSPEIFGFALLMISNLFFACGNVFISKLENRQQWSQIVTAKGMAIGACLSAIVCVVSSPSNALNLPELKFWMIPIYLGVVATGLGFFLWNRGVQKVSATPASVIGNFKAPLAIAWGALLLSEQVKVQMIVGLILMLAAVFILPKKISIAA